MPDECRLPRAEREIALLMARGADPKAIAGTQEIAVSTAYTQIGNICERVGVPDRIAFLIWVLQHPGCLFPGVSSSRGLHDQPCSCGSSYCVGLAAAQQPPT